MMEKFIPTPEDHGHQPVDGWSNNPPGKPEKHGRKPMVWGFIDFLAQRPAILDFLRALLENNHRGEKEVIRRELPERLAQRVLDLGCGTGIYAPFFGSDYVGIDISPTCIKYAQQRYAKNFQVMDAQKLDFPSESFNAIWVSGVFHHLDDAAARAILREMKRVLEKNGRAVVMEDIPSQKFISKIIEGRDLGQNIRRPEDYSGLWREYFFVQKEYPVRTGVCDFQVFVLTTQ